ncbi:sensor histidine kinase [Halodesulfovibrio spirochaetisodalis]|uniref:histidine kinase n=1 Tax=Halodesulfovibrio spirochaetisodalis TaxID=1560234 RepID=A0A1B7XFJ9_9BACT|nr:HAMP domain-containing sensor histidine kinase [Halodesulfovibrio spirochaetisodalis]OBQ54076.1 hypothetical protein SP90_06325 [Halodesulfovibrio spirochaetisodalis]
MAKKSLRKTIIIFFAVITFLLVCCYTVLLQHFFIRGLDLNTEVQLAVEAYRYNEKYKKQSDIPLPSNSNLSAYTEYEQLPEKIKKKIAGKAVVEGRYITINDEEYEYHKLYPFLRADGKIVYFLFSERFDDVKSLPTMKQFDMYFLYTPLLLGGACILLILSSAWFMLRRVARPVEKLSNWAVQIKPDSLEKKPESFIYEELDTLAGLFHEGMQRLNDSAKREQQFQKFASHELRTPVAVMLNNVELLQRLGIEQNALLNPPFLRMKKATYKMHHMSNLLLWLCRDDAAPLPVSAVHLHVLLHDAINENLYLTNGKEISIHTKINEVTVQAPQIALQILISNLIRNAFQHTHQGGVCIETVDNGVMITNDQKQGDNSIKKDSFGFGLELSKQLARKIGCELTLLPKPTTYTVLVYFKDS